MYLHAKSICIAIAASLVLSSCATINAANDRVEVTEEASTQAQAKLDAMRSSGAIVKNKRPKIAGEAISLTRPSNLPQIFDQKFRYISAFASPEIALQDVAKRTGYQIVFQGDSAIAPRYTKSIAEEAQLLRSVDWTGDLKGLLTNLAGKIDRYWLFRDGAIHIIKTDTRSFSIYLPTGKKTLSANIALAGEGDSSGNVSVSTSTTVDPYTPLMKSITALVADGSTTIPQDSVVLNEALGLLTVTASPPQLDKIATIIDQINERFAQNVLIGVKVFSLNITDSAVSGASLDALYTGISKNLNAQLIASPIPTPVSGTPGQLIVSPSTGEFAGSQAIVNALNELGKVSFVTSGQVVAANGQPSPLQVANEFTFLASSSTTTSTNVGTTTTLTPDSRKVGFTANFLPLLLGDNRILLQYQINLSSLLSLTQISSNGSSIQTPNIATQSLQQQAFVRDGQSIVLFGFEQDRTATNNRMSFSSSGTSASRDRNVMVIILEVSGGK